MAKPLALVGGALLAMYTISHGCSYLKDQLEQRAIPFERSAHIDPERTYKVISNNVEMSLPGYELARRPSDMSIDVMLKRAKENELIAKVDEQ